MNALVRKEIRMILPAWAGAMVLAILPIWIFWPGPNDAVFVPPGTHVFGLFAMGALVLGLTSFGQELNLGTFSMLLAQPVSRRRLWLCKTAVAATALALAFAALYVSVQLRLDSVMETMKSTLWRTLMERPTGANPLVDLIGSTRHSALAGALVFGGIAVMAAFSGGRWTTMLFRQASAAFWFTLLIPMGLVMLAGKIFGGWSAGSADAGLLIMLGLYSVAGFLWAKRQFLSVQDTQWTGGIIAFPAWPGSRSSDGAGIRKRRPLRALVGKEFQFQHVNLLIAGLLLLAHLADLAVRKIGAEYFSSHRSVAMIWESWPLLWLVMPLLIGGVSVAEERKMGTMEGFLCLPTTRRREFLVKLVTVLFLGFVLGGAMPVLLEGLGAQIGLPRNDTGVVFDLGWHMPSLVAMATLGSAGLTVLAFYASTLTRNLLQALGLAVLMAVLACGLIGLISRMDQVEFDVLPLWRGPLVGYIMWPVMLAAVGLLAFGNFKQAQVNAKLWSRNILVLLAALVGSAALTTLVYHRAWELWLPTEPVHPWWNRHEVISDPATSAQRDPASTNRYLPPKIEASRARVAVLLHDGRLWLRQRQVQDGELTMDGHPVPVFYAVGPWQSGFVNGSKWRDVAVTMKHTFAIQADGSLWDLSAVQPGNNAGGAGPRRIGDSSDWQHIAASRQGHPSARREHFVALKSDGTLWEWGDKFIPDGEKVATQKISEPAQVGHDDDWTAICDSQNVSVALKRDGSLWQWGQFFMQYTNRAWTAQAVVLPERCLRLTGPQPAVLSSDDYGHNILAVCADGSMWIGGDSEGSVNGMAESFRGTTWTQAEFRWWRAGVGVGRDGSLREWGRRDGRLPPQIGIEPPEIISRYSSWVAACPFGNAFIALANDGSLCLWGEPDGDVFDAPYDHMGGPRPDRLLLPSRIKATKFASLLP